MRVRERLTDVKQKHTVPTKADTQGRTDAAVNQFLQGRKREDVVLATKVAGRSGFIDWLPRAEPGTMAKLTKEQILYSVDESLKRLGTDYIDLLQLHWPGKCFARCRSIGDDVYLFSKHTTHKNVTSVDCLDSPTFLPVR